MKLIWKDTPNLLLTEEAEFNGFRYVVYWGCVHEQWNANAYHGDTLDNGVTVTKPNFGREECVKWCEDHAKKHSTLWQRLVYWWGNK